MGRKRKRHNPDIACPLKHLTNPAKDTVHQLFQKKFTYSPPQSSPWELVVSENNTSDLHTDSPHTRSEDVLYPPWDNEELMRCKEELNNMKSLLNNKDLLSWHQHTRFTSIAGNINGNIRSHYRPELCTQAWCKFYEIISSYPLLDLRCDKLFTVHLCEAPGAFLTSLNQFLHSHGYKGDWKWMANTLSPYHEGNQMGSMIDDVRLIGCSYGNWHFGEDNTGDLMKIHNLRSLQQTITSHGTVNLVTADGSIDCQGDPGEQENIVSQLMYTEILTALTVLGTGGCFVLKTFTLYEDKAICLMYLLNCVFTKVEVFKPCTSKGGNSETYVICMDYKGVPSQTYIDRLCHIYFADRVPAGCIFSMDMVPSSFLQQHIECCKIFKEFQSSTIQRNLDLCGHMTDELLRELENMKEYCSEYFFKRFKVVPLQWKNRLIKYKDKQQGSRHVLQGKAGRDKELAQRSASFNGTFNERVAIGQLSWQQRLDRFSMYEGVEEDTEILWLKRQLPPLAAETVSQWKVTEGRPVLAVNSSRFCDINLMLKTRDLIQYSQCLGQKNQTETEFNNESTKTLVENIVKAILTRNETQDVGEEEWDNVDMVMWNRGQVMSTTTMVVDVPHTSSAGCTPRQGDMLFGQMTSSSNNLKMPTGTDTHRSVHVNTNPRCNTHPTEGSLQNTDGHEDKDMNKISIMLKDEDQRCSAVFKALEEQINFPPDQLLTEGSHVVSCHCVRSGPVSVMLDAADQERFRDTVINILESCPVDGTVILELGPCLTRFNAGLVYILYRSFTKLGVCSPVQGSDLTQHLIGCGYTPPTQDVLQYLHRSRSLSVSNRRTVLELVPIQTLVEDAGFVDFLRDSNARLLKMFINCTIQQERKIVNNK